MTVINWIIVVIALLVASWFVIDGTIALTKGDYITPKSGKYAGQLGPWSKLVNAQGIEPRSALMKSIFMVYGVIWITVIVCYFLRFSWSWMAMMILAVGSLWYLPFGTLLGIVQIILLVVSRSK